MNPKSDLALFCNAANPLYVENWNKMKSDLIEWRLVDHSKIDLKLSIKSSYQKIFRCF